MCGISGFNWQDKALIKKMSDEISHRGPDDSGIYTDKGISLGHRRLSILDLSKKGHQPMSSGKNQIIFNGEIWNFKEIKHALIKKGYKFKSNTDTEVVLKGYEEYGEGICSLLEGMFAFALWDFKNKKLLLARDGSGKKPLYYYFQDKLIFASEIKAILKHDIPREINLECLSDYLTLRFSPSEETMFKGIKKLPPGSYGILKKGKLTIEKYSSYPTFNVRNSPNVEKADALISQAVKKRLLSDVPIGVFLSGGLDSSAIVAHMSKFTDKIKTFSVTFNSKVDESKYARIVSKKFNTDHKEIKAGTDLLKHLPEVVYHFDEPLADAAALPTYLLCKEVSKHVKVALSGEGGDEVFGGYDNYNAIQDLRDVYKLPYFLRLMIKPIFQSLSALHGYPKKQYYLAISKILSQKNIKSAFKQIMYFPFDREERKKIFKDAKNTDAFDKFLDNKALDTLIQDYYFKEWLPNDLLMKADKMSMASGLEVRTPFLDKDLVDYFSGLRYRDKYKRNLFRKAISRYLPEVIMKKKKQGFTLPLYEWFSDESQLKRILPFLQKLKSRGIFNEAYIDYLVENPQKYKNEHKIWVLLNFELWYEIFLEGKDYREIKL